MTKAIPTPFSATGTHISGTAYSQHDDLKLPNGKKIGEVESAPLSSVLQSYGIDGVSPSNPRDANIQAYAKHIDGLRKQAGDNAVAEYAKGKGLPEVVHATLSAADTARLLHEIPGVSHSNGKSANVDLYQGVLDSVRQQAADAAVNSWLRSKA